MAKKAKKAPAKGKTRAAAAKKPAKRPRKKPSRRKTARRPGPLRRLENALLASAAEVDELAVDLGLSGAVEPPPRSRGKTAKR